MTATRFLNGNTGSNQNYLRYLAVPAIIDALQHTYNLTYAAHIGFMTMGGRRPPETALRGAQSHRAEDIESGERTIPGAGERERHLGSASRDLVASNWQENVEPAFLGVFEMCSTRDYDRQRPLKHCGNARDLLMAAKYVW